MINLGILASCLALGLSTANYNQASNSEDIFNVQSHSQRHEVIFSFKDVFRNYYDQKNEKFKQAISFDDFCDGYYQSNHSFEEYITSTDCFPTIKESTNRSTNSIEILSPDEDYILSSDIGSSDFTNAEYFQREPQYGLINLPSLMIGDIVVDTLGAGGLGHTAFITKTNQPSYYGNYLQTIEAVASGVKYGFLDDNRIIDFGVTIYRVYRAAELGVTTNARTFLESHLGNTYSTDFSCTHIDSNRTSWYCSELIYAAYYNSGMDILYTPTYGNFEYQNVPFAPNLLLRNRFFGSFFFDSFLYISAMSFVSHSWTIQVKNLTNESVLLKYNRKMCNLNDAQNWTNLNDVRTQTLPANSTTSVSISENFFATSIAFSYASFGCRYITAANNLNKNNLSMTCYYSKLELI